MKNKLFVIFGTRDKQTGQKSVRPVKRNTDEPNIDILKQSPCRQCELYILDAVCPYVEGCSKIDEFQRVAAVHCTLYKDQDVFSILKI